MNCSIEIPTDVLHATVSTNTRLDSLSLQSPHVFSTNMVMITDGVTESKMNNWISPNLVEIPRGCAVEGTRFNPGHNQETMDFTNESSGIGLSQRMVKPITLTTNSPSSDHENDGTMEDSNLNVTKGWEPDRTQGLKRKYYEWAAVEAAFRRPRSARAHNAGRGVFIPQTNRAHPNQQRINPDTTQEITDMAYQFFDDLEINSPVPTFSPMPGDIICSQVCREIQQTNPYFNPGGHCQLYIEPGQPIDRALQLSAAGRREDAGLPVEPQFHPYDMIVRPGRITTNYQFMPQAYVEVFRFMGSQHTPCPWILIGRTPFQPLAAPVLYATGDPEIGHRVVSQFIPEARIFGQNMGFQLRPTDLLLMETYGFSQVQVSYYDHRRSQLEPRAMILRAGYARVEDSLLATVEMFQYLLNGQTQRMGWSFQGRDVQIYGGSQTLDTLVQAIDPAAIAGPRAPASRQDIALADSYLNL
ncbi:hypothetical protein R1sor_000289 [Riccia sorocarpa]|uniref:Uncharacterized protein n=1 Tax=Riccia sorocarpa TaxID=122646 RepID=A0ABD3GVR0_9MARC